jgi:hypothetical protein
MPTFVFEEAHAKEYGVHEAVILHNFIFWIKHNKANNRHFHDGRYWTYNTIKAFEELFPFFTKSQIRTALNNLQKNGAIITGEYNKLSFDRTIWYALTDKIYAESIDKTELLKIATREVKISNSDLRNLANGAVKNSTTIPDINTYNKPYNKKAYPPKELKEHEIFDRRKYEPGELENYYQDVSE